MMILMMMMMMVMMMGVIRMIMVTVTMIRMLMMLMMTMMMTTIKLTMTTMLMTMMMFTTRGSLAIGGEFAPHPPTHMSFDTARIVGHKSSKMLMRGEGPDCQRINEEHCLAAKRLVANDRGPAVAGHGS
jgi:hypothetical protein